MSSRLSNPLFKRFYEHLTVNPACSICKQMNFVDPETGQEHSRLHLDKSKAIDYPYITINYPSLAYLVFDCDHDKTGITPIVVIIYVKE